ncbi:hypothetical protein E3J62_00030 [candidate division TA06 bacterium]|uniref:Uncharacterized protein n=1 Tax=candidate division TA06 bacterium TaxID=2250710 RepID=A0A523UZF1_UNCT6|nr:MAG: hypothetical protein E3J62_00030 [candidate division TA06 bacterium]
MCGLRLLCVCALVLVPGFVLAQESGDLGVPAGEAETALESPVDPETYVLGPGDGLFISLTGSITDMYWGSVTLQGRLYLKTPVSRVTIGEASNLRIPVYKTIDRIQVSGMTLANAEKKANEVASKYFKDVQVSLGLARFRRCKVFVVGDVFKPGVVGATPVTRASEVLKRAELQGTASRASIELLRGGDVHSIINLYSFELTGDASANPFVMDGDIIMVPAMKKRVTVRGAVYGSGVYSLRISALTAEQTRTSEGIYELEAGDKATEIVRKAGGVAPWADLRNSYVKRRTGAESKAIKIGVDLEKVLVEGDTLADVLMEDGDILVIPSVEDVVYVEGAVNAPGAILYQPELGALSYIGLAGGPTDRASMGRVKVRRPNGDIISANGNPEIRRGDAVIVPEVTLRWWQDYLTIGTAVTSVVIAWLTIAR